MYAKDKKTNVKNIRFSDNDLKRAEYIINYLNEELGLELTFSDLICMLIKSEYNKRSKINQNN